jgi:hypothetical protein
MSQRKREGEKEMTSFPLFFFFFFFVSFGEEE